MIFLDSIRDDQTPEQLERQAKELIEFASSLEMGSFYGERLKEALHRPRNWYIHSLYEEDMRAVLEREKHSQEYRDLLRNSRAIVEPLVIEMLRFQKW
jgi:hypothetical protein